MALVLLPITNKQNFENIFVIYKVRSNYRTIPFPQNHLSWCLSYYWFHSKSCAFHHHFITFFQQDILQFFSFYLINLSLSRLINISLITSNSINRSTFNQRCNKMNNQMRKKIRISAAKMIKFEPTFQVAVSHDLLEICLQ